MNYFKNILIIFCLCTGFGCDDLEIKPSIVEECTSIKDAKFLSKDDTTCWHSEVYLYKGELFTVGTCCVCDMIAIAVDCDGVPLCEFGGADCMVDFFKNAEHKFNIVK